jgi:hypothetical protein
MTNKDKRMALIGVAIAALIPVSDMEDHVSIVTDVSILFIPFLDVIVPCEYVRRVERNVSGEQPHIQHCCSMHLAKDHASRIWFSMSRVFPFKLWIVELPGHVPWR